MTVYSLRPMIGEACHDEQRVFVVSHDVYGHDIETPAIIWKLDQVLISDADMIVAENSDGIDRVPETWVSSFGIALDK